MQVFVIHGAFAGIAAVLFATQLRVIQSTVPPNLELTIITASVVGGVSILGGIGSVVGSTLAAILLAAIASSLIFLNVSPYWIRAVQGVLILITVLADLWRRRRQAGALMAAASTTARAPRGRAMRSCSARRRSWPLILAAGAAGAGLHQRAVLHRRQPAEPGPARLPRSGWWRCR